MRYTFVTNVSKFTDTRVVNILVFPQKLHVNTKKRIAIVFQKYVLAKFRNEKLISYQIPVLFGAYPRKADAENAENSSFMGI